MTAAVFYLDASALVKRYRREMGTDVLDQLLEAPLPQEHFYISSLLLVEFRSFVARQVAPRSQVDADSMVGRFRQDIDGTKFRVLPLADVPVETAVSYAFQYRLRALDAIHLASAGVIFDLAGAEPQKVLVSADRELLRAAENSGFKILNPSAHSALDILASLRT